MQEEKRKITIKIALKAATLSNNKTTYLFKITKDLNENLSIDLIKRFDSMTLMAEYLGITRKNVHYYLSENKLYKGKYIISYNKTIDTSDINSRKVKFK